jgi:hypothetical protein
VVKGFTGKQASAAAADGKRKILVLEDFASGNS